MVAPEYRAVPRISDRLPTTRSLNGCSLSRRRYSLFCWPVPVGKSQKIWQAKYTYWLELSKEPGWSTSTGVEGLLLPLLCFSTFGWRQTK